MATTKSGKPTFATIRGYETPSATTGGAKLIDPFVNAKPAPGDRSQRQSESIQRNWASVGRYIANATNQYGRDIQKRRE